MPRLSNKGGGGGKWERGWGEQRRIQTGHVKHTHSTRASRNSQ